jgi:hypothetical protein
MNTMSSIFKSFELAIEVLLLPGEAVVFLLVNYSPPVADYFSLSTDETSTVTITAAVVIWLAAIAVTGTLVSKIRELDRTMTDWIVAGFEEIRRQVRVLKRRITSSLALRLRSRSNNDEAMTLDSIQLARLETSILRCLSRIDNGAILTTGEMAAKLATPERELKRTLQRLVELGLVESRSDSLTHSDGHCIATAGQMYLLGA